MVSNEVLIGASGLTKKYDNYTAVNGIDFEVYKGECVGFLGPNGAGKTTTIRMIYCFLLPSAGKLEVAGFDVHTECRKMKAVVGGAPQEDTLHPDVSLL